MELSFDERGLVTAVVQDVESGEVLMVAWMNAEAVRLTRETGEAHFWSRSRQEMWRKGATSGNVMAVQEMRVDCDGDTLLLRVRPAGPACHTGQRSCFWQKFNQPPGGPSDDRQPPGGYFVKDMMLQELFGIIEKRNAERPEGSYTAELLNGGEDGILKKVGEEAMEVILAAKGQGEVRLIEETADLFYHVLVLLAYKGLTLGDVEEELRRRHGEMGR